MANATASGGQVISGSTEETSLTTAFDPTVHGSEGASVPMTKAAPLRGQPWRTPERNGNRGDGAAKPAGSLMEPMSLSTAKLQR